MTNTSPARPLFSEFAPPPSSSGPLLVASDGSADSDGAVRLAYLLAARTNASVHVVSVVEPIMMPMYAFDAMPVVLETAEDVRVERQAKIQAQIARSLTATAPWPIMVRGGEPVREIAGQAREQQARAMLVGRGRHGRLARLMGGESVLRLLQRGDAPVFAVEADLTTLPRTVVIAVDFSAYSIFAAEVALPMVAADATVLLVHVAPPFAQLDPRMLPESELYREQAQVLLRALAERLARPGLTIEELLLEGDAREELLQIVEQSAADLVVTATHGYGMAKRLMLGSVATTLVREAPCSVLCVPGVARTHALAAQQAHARMTAQMTTQRFAPDTFDAELNAFAKRNEGRGCTVEIDQASIGAQVLGHALPLVGATYDRNSRRVSLMFGASSLAGEHVTHAVANVSAIAVTTGASGRDEVLAISYDGGQALVYLA